MTETKSSKTKTETKKTVKTAEKKQKKEAKEKKQKKKRQKPETEIEKKPSRETEKTPKYFEAVGRRKTSTARVRLFTHGVKEIKVNEKLYKDYFPIFLLQKKVEAPLEELSCLEKFGISIKVKGGGLSSQAEACRHGIARALILLNPYFKKRLKKYGFLTRDPRMRERKKFGLKRARRAPQWSKR